jgi:hypothetical protein
VVLTGKSYIERQIKEALESDEKHEFGKEYLNLVLDKYKEVTHDVRRRMAFILLLAGAFELFSRSAIGKLALGPFEVNRLSIVQAVIPLLIAYLFYEVCYLGAWSAELDDVYAAVISVVHPGFYRTKVYEYILPTQPGVLGPNLYGERGKFFDQISFGVGLLTFLGPLLFEIYAYVIQFKHYGLRSIPLWISLILAVVLVLLGFRTLFSEPRDASRNQTQLA